MTASMRPADPGRTGEPDPDEIADRLEQLAKKIRSQGLRALDRSHDWATGVTVGGGETNRRSKGDHSDPTAAAAFSHMKRPAGIGTWYDAFCMRLDELHHTLAITSSDITRIVRVADLEERTEALRQPGAGHCQACAEHVPGIGNDRIVEGFCSTCGRAWRRYKAANAQPSRSEFIYQRRQTDSDEQETA